VEAKQYPTGLIEQLQELRHDTSFRCQHEEPYGIRVQASCHTICHPASKESRVSLQSPAASGFAVVEHTSQCCGLIQSFTVGCRV
jgi:hypothetical protein